MYKKIFILSLVFVIGFSVNILAVAPTPVYRIPAGQELEYISKLVQELNYLFELNEKGAKIFANDLDNSAMMSLMMGNGDIIDVIANDDLHKMSREELSQWFENDIMEIYDGTIDLFEDVPEDIQNIRNQEAQIEVNYIMEEPVPGVSELKKYANQDPENKNNTENKKKLIEKAKIVNKNYENSKKLYQELDKNYDQEKSQLDNSNINDFIDKNANQLEKVNKNFNDNVDRITPALSYKLQVQLQMQNNAMMLQMLRSMRDLNRQMLLINSILNKQNLEEELNRLKNQYHY